MQFYVGSTSHYLTSFLDDFSRFIVSFEVSDNQSSQVILSLLRRAVSFRKPLSILSDRGIQFSSWNGVTAFQMELKTLGIDHLLAREQHPETVGFIERYFRTLRKYLFRRLKKHRIAIHQRILDDYSFLWNFCRQVSGKNNTPAELAGIEMLYEQLSRF